MCVWRVLHVRHVLTAGSAILTVQHISSEIVLFLLLTWPPSIPSPRPLAPAASRPRPPAACWT